MACQLVSKIQSWQLMSFERYHYHCQLCISDIDLQPCIYHTHTHTHTYTHTYVCRSIEHTSSTHLTALTSLYLKLKEQNI